MSGDVTPAAFDILIKSFAYAKPFESPLKLRLRIRNQQPGHFNYSINTNGRITQADPKRTTYNESVRSVGGIRSVSVRAPRLSDD